MCRLKSNGRTLGAKLRLLLEIQSAFDLDEGFANVALEDLIQATRLKRRTVIKLVKELIADGVVACVGPNRLSFRADVFGADAFGAYDGPVFIAENHASILGFAAVNSGSGVDEIRVDGSEIPVIYTDYSSHIPTLNRESALRACQRTAEAAAAAARSSARAREAVAAIEVARPIDAPKPRLGIDAYRSLLGASIDERGFDGLSDETYFELACEAVRGRMMADLEHQRVATVAALKDWAKEWKRIPYLDPASLFVTLWARAEKQDPKKPIRSFSSFFAFAINDCIQLFRHSEMRLDAPGQSNT
ncbi:hypothetical protein [Hyphomicrobium sp. 99]|uniref:hypothetical protein n=1 Tax=Hyphomicrobium sp. 99 TaxID=1163419 RepID=UPI0012E054E3|nr:hypothetical protein [Hyphomicrobium sp. 99]